MWRQAGSEGRSPFRRLSFQPPLGSGQGGGGFPLSYAAAEGRSRLILIINPYFVGLLVTGCLSYSLTLFLFADFICLPISDNSRYIPAII